MKLTVTKNKQVLLCLIAAIPFMVSAQKNYTALLDRYMQAYAKVHDFSGAVLVAKKGKVIYQKAFQFANREWQVPNTVSARFEIGSITKQFTAAAVLQLAEQGKLQVEDKLSKYFPDYPKGDSITLHMLLNHTSGIYNYSDNPAFFDLNPNTPIAALKDTLLNLFKNKSFYFSPGTWWRYSNSNYLLLGYIIEKVSGQTFQDYIFKNLLQKAGMANTGILRHDTIVPRFANGYTRTPAGWTRGGIAPVNAGYSAGGLFSTVGDLLKWGEALRAGKIISAASLEKMNRPNHEDRGYGYGVFVDRFFNHRAIFHGGATLGYNTYMIYYPEDDLRMIFLANKDTRLDFLPKAFAAILFDHKVSLPYKRTPVAIDPTRLKQYVGSFQGQGVPFLINIIEKKHKLYLQLHQDIELYPESETKFYIGDSDVEMQLEYVLDARKEVERIYFIDSGVKTEVKRIESSTSIK
jgi:CubicO group peptidase (beta-lactamase class C family)